MMRLTVLCVSLLLLNACGGGSSDGATANTTGTSGGVGSSGKSTSTSTSTGTGTGSSGTAAPSSSGGSGPELGVCERLIGCATSLEQPLSGLVGMYGETGSCWADFEPSVCWADCRAALRELGATSDASECLECESDSDCTIWAESSVCSFDGECAASAPCIGWVEKLQGCCEHFADQGNCPQILESSESSFNCPAAHESCGEAGSQSMSCALELGCSDFLVWYHECHLKGGPFGFCGSDGAGFISEPTPPYEGACISETSAYQSCYYDDQDGDGGY